MSIAPEGTSVNTYEPPVNREPVPSASPGNNAAFQQTLAENKGFETRGGVARRDD